MTATEAERRPIPILYLITELSVTGGAERLMPRLLGQLDRSAFLPTVACLYGADGPVAERIRALGVPVYDLEMNSKWRLDSLGRLYRLLRTIRPTIVHGSLFHANVLARVLGRLAGVPVVVSWRHSVDIGGPTRELINRLTAPLGDRVVAVCELAREAELARARLASDRVLTIYNGVESQDYCVDPTKSLQIREHFDVSPDAPLLGTIGRMSPAKDFHTLLLALAQVKEIIPAVRLFLVGEGEMRGELEDATESLGLADTVVFTGIREDVPHILAALDCFVLSSLWEGLPLALLEAMAGGLPVVATAVGGVPEVVVDGLTGALVPPQDPAALASAIIRLLQDPDLRDTMGRAGRERVHSRFHIAQTARLLESLYHQLVREKSGRYSSG